MKRALLLVATLAATAAIAQDSMSAMKGKMKDGRYAYKMEMDMGQVPGGARMSRSAGPYGVSAI